MVTKISAVTTPKTTSSTPQEPDSISAPPVGCGSTAASCHVSGEQGPMNMKYNCVSLHVPPKATDETRCTCGAGRLEVWTSLAAARLPAAALCLRGPSGTQYGRFWHCEILHTHSITKCHWIGKFSNIPSHKYNFSKKTGSFYLGFQIFVTLRLPGPTQT